jgi:hypothetical protein
MTYKKLIINLLFGATFFNHLHVLSFIPQHNRPLLLLLFPVVILYIYRYDLRIDYNLILWIIGFFFIAFVSTIWNLFFGEFNYYFPEIIKRIMSYIVLFYFVVVGIIFGHNKKIISNKFYTFFIIIGVIQIYALFNFPFSSIIINLFENHLIDSFSSVGDKILFFEAEPSYVAFLIIFLMVFYERKNTFIWLVFSFLTISVRTTMVSFLYYIKNRPVTYSLIMLIVVSVFLTKTEVSYSVFTRLKALTTFQQLDPATYIRVVNNKIGLQIINDYPIFGVGPGQYSTYYSGKYLSNYDTRGIRELKNVLKSETKTADPYSLFIGIISELGLFSFLWILISFMYLYYKSHRKYLVALLFLILMWGYPFGKPYIWIILGFIYEENKIRTINNYKLSGIT